MKKYIFSVAVVMITLASCHNQKTSNTETNIDLTEVETPKAKAEIKHTTDIELYEGIYVGDDINLLAENGVLYMDNDEDPTGVYKWGLRKDSIFGVECWHFNIVPSKDDDNVVGSIHCAVDGFDDFEGEPTKNKKLSEILAMLDLKLNKYTGVNGKASKNGKETTWTTDKLIYSLTWNSFHAKTPETYFEYDHINIYLDITPTK